MEKILGQEHCKRGLEVALTGGHGVLLIGPPNAGKGELTRAAQSINKLLVIYSAEPCACGYFTDPQHECKCTPQQIQNHLTSISRAVPLDKIAIHIEVPRQKIVSERRRGESTDVIVERIKTARKNARPDVFDKEAEELLKLAILELGISCLAYDKICAVAATIAQMDGAEAIEAHHVSEAISYRSLDRNLWG